MAASTAVSGGATPCLCRKTLVQPPHLPKLPSSISLKSSPSHNHINKIPRLYCYNAPQKSVLYVAGNHNHDYNHKDDNYRTSSSSSPSLTASTNTRRYVDWGPIGEFLLRYLEPLLLTPLYKLVFGHQFCMIAMSVRLLVEDGAILHRINDIIEELDIVPYREGADFTPLFNECIKCLLEFSDRWVATWTTVTPNAGKALDKLDEFEKMEDFSQGSIHCTEVYIKGSIIGQITDKYIHSHEDFKEYIRHLTSTEYKILTTEASCWRRSMSDEDLKRIHGYIHFRT